jgi:hypothetical protein
MKLARLPAVCILAVAISVSMSGCALAPTLSAAKANPIGWAEASAGGAGSPSGGVATQGPGSAQSSKACTVMQRDVTAAMSELQVRGFSDWESSLNSGFVVGGASMTNDPGRISSAMRTVTILLDGPAAAPGSAAEAISIDLSDTGGNFEELASGSGTAADEAMIVRALSKAAADAFSICGPSPYTQYAPAQESALDDDVVVQADEGFVVGSLLSPSIATTSGDVKQEATLDALGPQGGDGDCTIPFKMDSFAQQAAEGENGFEQNLRIISVGASEHETDITRLRSDIATIREERIASPEAAQQALQAATQALTQGIAVANTDIDTENDLIEQAFSTDDKMAKAPACVNAAVGKPSLLGHLSLSPI